MRTIRNLLGIGISWATAWALLVAVVVTIIGIVSPEQIDAGEGPLRAGAILGGVGLIAGLLFGVLTFVLERGKRIGEVALSHAALWGVVASAVFPLVTGRADQVFVLCPIGALLAVATVLTARRVQFAQ